MTFRKVAAYAVPAGSLVLAGAVHLSGAQLEALPFWIRLSILLLGGCLLFTTVFIVLHHAEAIAVRLGEPYGTLILTIAVTAIELSLIVSMMLHGENNPTLARESVFSTVMIVCCGVVGVCLTLGGWRHHRQDLKRQGTSASLSVLIALTVLALILPNFTIATGPGTFSPLQLAFVSVLSILLYAGFVFAQTMRYRDDFIQDRLWFHTDHDDSASSTGQTIVSAVFMIVGLLGIVLLAEFLAAKIEDGLLVLQISQSDAIVGALIASLVLLPEALSAVRAAYNNELQRSLNVALGSALATIGLTIPGVAVASLITGREITLGLLPGDTVLLVLALVISVVSFGTGQTTLLTGLVHLVVFVAYLLLIFVP